MLSVLCSGTLVSDPKSRVSAKGSTYCTCTLRALVDGDEAVLVSCIAFDAATVQSILALTKGDACAIAGRAKLSSWTKDGEEKHGLSVVADKVLTVYQIEKKRRQTSQPEEAVA